MNGAISFPCKCHSEPKQDHTDLPRQMVKRKQSLQKRADITHDS
jgi:hypothetical protein